MIMEGKDKYMAERIILEEKANKVVFREGDVIVKEYVPSHPKEGVFNEAHIHAFLFRKLFREIIRLDIKADNNRI